MIRFQPAVTVTTAAAAQFGNQVYQRYIADHPSSRPGSRASPVAPMDQQQVQTEKEDLPFWNTDYIFIHKS